LLSVCFPLLLQLCESLKELLNVNGELRSDGQAVWTLLGGILGQVTPPPSVLPSTHTHQLWSTFTEHCRVWNSFLQRSGDL